LTPRHAGLVFFALAGSLAFPQSPADVSVSFDHVVRPAAARRDIDSALLFLRLKNNSRAPIQVLASAPQTGATGAEVEHEIVPASGSAKPEPGWISPPEHYSPVNEATTVEIQPNTDLLFSVPLNHVGPTWSLRITFEFVRPKARSGQREGMVDFTWADVPVKERDAWKKTLVHTAFSRVLPNQASRLSLQQTRLSAARTQFSGPHENAQATSAGPYGTIESYAACPSLLHGLVVVRQPRGPEAAL
jgi:hypothetical protein